MTLLDTNIVSSFIDPRARERYPKLVEFVTTTMIRESGMFIAFVSQYELRRGLEELAHRGEGWRKRVVVERFLGTALVLGLDERRGEGWNIAARL
jgi:predicted nucleic acid-binding protein